MSGPPAEIMVVLLSVARQCKRKSIRVTRDQQDNKNRVDRELD